MLMRTLSFVALCALTASCHARRESSSLAEATDPVDDAAVVPCSEDTQERSTTANGDRRLTIAGEIVKASGQKSGWIICPRVAPDYKANCSYQIVTDDTVTDKIREKLVKVEEELSGDRTKMVFAKVIANQWIRSDPMGFFIEDIVSVTNIKAVSRCGKGNVKRSL